MELLKYFLKIQYRKIFHSRAIIFYKSLLVFEGPDVAYLQIPKAACSSIKAYLIDKAHLSLRSDLNRQVALHDDESFSTTYKSASNYKWLKDKEVALFTVVRNPFTRVLSAYIEKIEKQKDVRKDYRSELGLNKSGHVSFCEFLVALSQQHPHTVDLHFMPQSIIVDQVYNQKLYVGFMEAIEDAFTEIDSFFESHVISKSRIENYHEAPHSVGASEYEIISKYYGDREIALVKEFYATDFIFFGYSTSIEKSAFPGEKQAPLLHLERSKIPALPLVERLRIRFDSKLSCLYRALRA